MNRRHVLLAIGSTTGVSGYLWFVRWSFDPKPLPDRPETLTPETVTSYVEEYEKTVTLNEHEESEGYGFSIGCEGTLDRTVDDHYVVVVFCSGINRSTGILESDIHYHFQKPFTTYIVNAESTTRFEWIGYDFRRGSHDENPILRCANFTDADQQVSIAVTPHNGTPDPVFRESITVPGERDETIETVVDDYGTYDVTARLGDDTTETYEWEYTEDTAEDSIGVGVYIMPDGTIDIDRLEIE